MIGIGLAIMGVFSPMLTQDSKEYKDFRRQLAAYSSPLEIYLESCNAYRLHKDKLAGHITDAQKLQMNEVLSSYSTIKTIGEIGLNFGHSAENFFRNCKELESYYSFDINYLPEVVDYFRNNYKSQFHFLHGDSLETVPELARQIPTTKLDLIFIDGAHNYNHCLHDIQNMRSLADEHTYLWIDDYYSPEVFEAVETCKSDLGILEICNIHVSDFQTTGERCWIEARYLFAE